MNIQFVIQGGSAYRSPNLPAAAAQETTVYVLEVNPGAADHPLHLQGDRRSRRQARHRHHARPDPGRYGLSGRLWPRQKLVGIKAPVFSMSKLVGVDWFLGPEMKSTGEVMGVDAEFPSALSKALVAANLDLQRGMGVLVSIADRNKAESVPLVRELVRAGCRIYATEGTAAMINALGLEVELIPKKLGEGHPNVLDIIEDGSVAAVVNTIGSHPR